ncbi:hypothetical protein Glove_97g84 [Diversispora epigaea]|uniref:Methyltransferase domain-containing protein n=1 Tax=Diversispora epigaea TaxID=1348612 RepID=A0A397JDL2_9GLOM|nr:hypothetical protein Glove_97g84 [Diversispora epigaea]
MGNKISKTSKKSTPLPSTNAQEDSDFRYIGGRRYHNVESLKYPLPNDDEELDRLHLQHFLLRYVWQRNFGAPVKHILNQDGTKALDVGCGAGSWIFEMASDYPNTQFTGLDISPIQPTEIKPKNVNFIKANLLNGLPFENDTFDYIFQRFLFSSIPKDSWPDVINELTRVLKPGGYLELVEINHIPFQLGPASIQLSIAVEKLHQLRDLDTQIPYKLRSYFEQQGNLENITEEKNRITYGPETGKLGQAGIENAMLVVSHLKTYLLEEMKMTSEEFDNNRDVIAKELREFDSYHDLRCVYARKKEIIEH